MARRMRAAQYRAEDGTVIYEVSMKKTVEKDGKTFTRIPREKPKSRATRCAEATMALDTVKSDLEQIVESIDDMAEGWDVDEACKKVEEIITSIDVSEIEALADEMENWRDNYPENLQSTDKYEQIDTAAETLRDKADELNDLTFQKAELSDAGEIEDLKEEFRDALNERIETLESAIDELNNVEFPGMFG